MKPYAIDHVENDEGTVIKSFKPSEYGSLMSEEESAILRQLMTDVVQEGTASKLKGLDYTAAGKTGSAEYNNIKGDSHYRICSCRRSGSVCNHYCGRCRKRRRLRRAHCKTYF